MKNSVFKLITIGVFSAIGTLAYAQDTTNANTLDIAYAFGDNSQTIHLTTLDSKTMQETQGAAIIWDRTGSDIYAYNDVTDEIVCKGIACKFYSETEEDEPNYKYHYNTYNPNFNNPHRPDFNTLTNNNSNANPWVRVVVNLGKRFVVGNREKTLTGHYVQNATLVGEVIRQGVKHNNERKDTCPAQVKCIY